MQSGLSHESGSSRSKNRSTQYSHGSAANRLLKADEAADYLRVSYLKMCLWRKQNEGPAYHRVGGRYLYSQADLDEFVRSTRRSTSDSN